MTGEEKEKIIRSLFWDYDIDTSQIMAMLENLQTADDDRIRRLFVRAFENLRWHELVSLFGADTVKRLCTEQTRRLLRREARERFDIACSILQGKTVPSSRQDTENRKLALKPFLSDRWYGSEQRILQS